MCSREIAFRLSRLEGLRTAGPSRRFRQVGVDTVEKVGVAVDAKF